jgi:predicted GNAT family N-acyltransferase
MSYHSTTLVKARRYTSTKRHFLSLDYKKYARGMIAFHPSEEELHVLFNCTAARVSPMASFATVLRVYRRNPDTILAFARERRSGDSSSPIGFLAHLPLNAEGLNALLDGRLNTKNPDDRYLARQHERPAALYYWAMYFTSEVGGGLALALERMTSEKYRDLPIYCKAATKEGWDILTSLGFTDGAAYPDGRKSSQPLMQCLPLDPAADRQLFDSYIPGVNAGTKKLSVTVVHKLDDLLKVFAIRAATYLEDQYIPYDEDVDGNDFTATHLLGFVGDEPAACLRIRYFAGFVKFERLAVLPRFRGKLALHIVRAGINFVQLKGYRRIYGQVADNVTNLWKHFGAKQRIGDGVQYLTDQTYYEMDIELGPSDVVLNEFSGASVLVRPEGQWDRPGVLELGQQDGAPDANSERW